MGKQKAPTPQEIYRARKQREEQEKEALLPPGFINHGNTCFMNSVLQGLVATELLSAMVQFRPVPSSIRLTSATPIDSRRSPQLTNGHGVAGQYERPWVRAMPVGDAFIAVMQRSWKIQREKGRESISPREILGLLGQKYDQYLDFRQQDAHEFLRHLIDAMSMEELDVIKQRQPAPPSQKQKKSRKSSGSQPVAPASSSSRQDQSGASHLPPQEDKLMSFADMIFGGRLTSLLVCQKCKHVSFTYEDFNDLSLSIKPEDYVRERKRDRLKTFAKKLKNFPTSIGAMEIQRSSSVPASPREGAGSTGPTDFPFSVDQRRRSLDYVGSDTEGERKEMEQAETNGRTEVEAVLPPTESTDGNGLEESGGASDSPGEHVEFSEHAKAEKKEKENHDDPWAKFGRRISMKVGLGKGTDRRKSRSRERGGDNGADFEREMPKAKESQGSTSPNESIPSRPSTTTNNKQSTPVVPSQGDSGSFSSPPSERDTLKAKDSNDGRRPGPSPLPPSSSPSFASLPRFPIIQRPSTPSIPQKRAKSPRPPKPSPEEAEFLRHILADINPSPSHSFNLFKPPNHLDSPPSAAQLWLKLDHLPGIEECLRMFTAVEILDGENMVGCRRCWKIANGEYDSRPRAPGHCFEDSDSDGKEGQDTGPNETNKVQQTRESLEDDDGAVYLPPRQAVSAPPSPSASSTVISSQSSFVSLDAQSSTDHAGPLLADLDSGLKSTPAPLSLSKHPAPSQITTYGGITIPVISTTAPESPISPPPTAKPLSHGSSLASLQSSLVRPQLLPSRSRDSLHAPTVQCRHSRQGAADSGEDSADEVTDGAETDTSAHTSAYSASSSVVIVSPAVSPRASQEHLPPSGVSPVIKPSLPAPSSTRVPRSKQVIMRPAYKRYLVATPPPVLVIHLKRFQQTSKTHMMPFSSHGFKKLDDYIAFPEELDLSPFLAPKKSDFGPGKKGKANGKASKDDRCMYRLYAVVVHIGNMLGGHYVAYTALPSSPQTEDGTSAFSAGPAAGSDGVPAKEKNPKRQWAYISDTVVRLATLEEVLKVKAYICMYERI